MDRQSSYQICTHFHLVWKFIFVIPGSLQYKQTIGVHVSFVIMVFLDICPGVGLLDHMVVLFLVKLIAALFAIAWKHYRTWKH